MAYEKKTWVDRQSEYPGRRKLTATGTADVYDVTREEGLIVEEGDALNAQNLNALEGRIEAGLGENPLPMEQFSKIYKDNVGILLGGMTELE